MSLDASTAVSIDPFVTNLLSARIDQIEQWARDCDTLAATYEASASSARDDAAKLRANIDGLKAYLAKLAGEPGGAAVDASAAVTAG